uniref:Zinc finger CCCH domain-containing protein 13 n=1 Tax=Elaeis guineensis var. tenera TaxID=51953 RepID=A0A6I9RSW6_ELAGV|nr:zinc finger CCCH domain-containing protein 13 [Elaeis guineensis]
MLGRKLYKTKLCILYQRGRCTRQSCNFAHGEAELRRFAGSFSGRREYRNGNLRGKLDRRHSPHRRYSPVRDARGHHSYHSHKSISHDRGSSHSRSPIKRSERRYRKKQRMDGESDVSGSFNISDGSEDIKKGDKVSFYNERIDLEEQIKQIQLDIEMLDDHKSQLEIFLEEKVDEAQKLSSRIEDLDSKLNKEQEDCKRCHFDYCKIKKFIKAHRHHMKAQEEMKRSQVRLQKLGDQISLDPLKTRANEEESSVNVVSDAEPNDDGDNQISSRNDFLQRDVSSAKRRAFVDPATSEEAKIGNSRKRGRYSDSITKSEKLIKSEGPALNSEHNSKGTDTTKTVLINNKSLTDDYKHKQGKLDSATTSPLDKVKGSESRRSLPSTSMAAHAVDELIEAIEMEEKPETIETAKHIENADAENRTKSACLPPPPPLVPQNAYKQYEGDDEDVEVEKVDAEMVDIDIDSEVEIEQI